MAVLYIKEQGAMLRRSGERVLVTKGTETLLDIPVFRIENVALIGNVQVSTQAARLMMENGVDVSYFTYGGKYLGRTTAEASGNIFLRFEQYQCYLDERRRLEIAEAIVRNKIQNQLALIRGTRWKDETFDWKSRAERIEKQLKQVGEKTCANELMGVEGICSQVYFQAFAEMLKGDFLFQGRNRRPPKDPVNILLSLTYSFLTREMSSALDADGFETCLGFLHGIRYGRKSLALDMIEEFRQPLADRLVLFLINKRILTKDDFDYTDLDRVTLSEDGFRRYCAEYERWMDGRNTISGEKSFRHRIRSQVNALRKALKEGDVYCPYRWPVGKEYPDVSNQL